MHMNPSLTLTLLFCSILEIFACTPPAADMPDEKTPSATVRSAHPDRPLDSLLKENGLQPADLHFFIDKSDLTLQVMADTAVIKTYPVVLGGNPVDDKRREGDQCTPEGEFQLRNLYPHNKWSKFLWVNYPTDESRKKHDAAKADGQIPSDATIGGEIGIHGVPSGCDHWIDTMEHWTLGCISLKNAHIDEIYAVAQKGTRVVIVP